MPRLYVICGHGAGDPGALGWLDGELQEEAACVRELARRMKLIGGDNVVLAPMDRNAYAESGLLNWSIPKDCEVVELHMDSAGYGARGAHVIYKSGYKADAFDMELARRIAQMFPGRNSSLVGRSDLKNVNQAAARGVPYRLVENGFISNEGDLRKFVEQLDELATLYLEVFGIATVENHVETPSEPVDENAVSAMQVLLNGRLAAFMSEPVEVTGEYDAQTQNGIVRLFQLSSNHDYGAGLVVDGISGGRTRAAIAANPVGMGFETVGNDVWAVKAALVGHGHDVSVKTWEWTDDDALALTVHQQAWGLDADEVCGPVTWATLVGAANV